MMVRLIRRPTRAAKITLPGDADEHGHFRLFKYKPKPAPRRNHCSTLTPSATPGRSAVCPAGQPAVFLDITGSQAGNLLQSQAGEQNQPASGRNDTASPAPPVMAAGYTNASVIVPETAVSLSNYCVDRLVTTYKRNY
jgi:hypothetical protein